MSERQECPVCDGPYCGATCRGVHGYVWANGRGWVSTHMARRLEQAGRTIQWSDVFTWERYGMERCTSVATALTGFRCGLEARHPAELAHLYVPDRQQ